MGSSLCGSKRPLQKSDAFCLSIAIIVALCCFNFGFQYGVFEERNTSNKGMRPYRPKSPTLRKLSNIIDVWEENDNWESVELRRGDTNKIDSNSKEDDDAISTSKEQHNAIFGKKENKNDHMLVPLPGKEGDKILGQDQAIAVNPRSSYEKLGIPETCEQMNEIDFNVILYNSLTMCASHILLNIAKYANNRLFVEDLKDPLHKSSHPEKDIVKYVVTKPLPSLFHSHTYFCPMASTDERNISFISMVRNPLDRLVSLYYSGTHAFRTAGVKVKDYNECVVSNDNVCVGNWTRHTLVRHFCGYDVKCAHASTWAFEKAKFNIANKYLVVGIVSDFERFMNLLEILAPTVFTGYSDLTVDMEKLLDKRIFGSTLDELSPEVKSKMEKHLEMDFRLYNFLRQRFIKQLQLCKIE